MAAKLSENTEVALPLRNIISMVAAASLATWAYFGIIERLNTIETNITMMKSNVDHNTEFRIKWPRGEMGSLPADSEQFMLIEHLADQLDELTTVASNGDHTGIVHATVSGTTSEIIASVCSTVSIN